jgi:hypothetical protein
MGGCSAFLVSAEFGFTLSHLTDDPSAEAVYGELGQVLIIPLPFLDD